MHTPQLGACERLVWDIRRGNLVDRARLEPALATFLQGKAEPEPTDLADYLVGQQLLTRFQADTLLAGKKDHLVLGPYLAVDALGVGSLGTVYRARSKVNGKLYAVKVLPKRSVWHLSKAKNLIKACEQVRHPAIVPFADAGISGSLQYLAWPFVEGMSLQTLVTANGPLPHALAAHYLLEAAAGLADGHDRGLVHGLIKPSNLLITAVHHVKILDLGVGALLGQEESVVDTGGTATTLASSADCASPESVGDPSAIGPAADQYSLGCTLFFALTGRYPFEGATFVDKMVLHQTQPAPRVTDLAPEVPADLADVVARMLQKQPAARFPSLHEVVAVLKPLVQAGAVADAPSWRSMPPASQPRAAGPDGAVKPIEPLPLPAEAPPGGGMTAGAVLGGLAILVAVGLLGWMVAALLWR
jgi:serine/threonine-protein kinase